MPAAEAKEGAAEPAANAGDALDCAQSLSEIVATMEHRLQAEIFIATEYGVTTNGLTLALSLSPDQVEIERMQAEGITPTDDSMYSVEAVQQRIDLLSDPVVVRALEDLWQAEAQTIYP